MFKPEFFGANFGQILHAENFAAIVPARIQVYFVVSGVDIVVLL